MLRRKKNNVVAEGISAQKGSRPRPEDVFYPCMIKNEAILHQKTPMNFLLFLSVYSGLIWSFKPVLSSLRTNSNTRSGCGHKEVIISAYQSR